MKWRLIALLLLILACKTETKPSAEKIPEIGLITENAMVVSAREEASKIGIDILKKGGNAFDAMVATELALAVVFIRGEGDGPTGGVFGTPPFRAGGS